jgi:hypothetical protein
MNWAAGIVAVWLVVAVLLIGWAALNAILGV